MNRKTRNLVKRLTLLLALLVLFSCLPAPVLAASIQKVDARFGCTPGEAVTVGDVLMQKSDGKCYKADADDATLRPAVGVAGFTAAINTAVEVVTRGQVGGETGLTQGGVVWLGTTAGAETQSAPTAYTQQVGRAISATEWIIDVAAPRVKTRSALIHIPDPGTADADITAGYVLWSPSSAVTITKILLMPQAAWVAAAAANDADVIVTNAAVGTLASLNIVTALAAGSKNDMGTITNPSVAADANVTIAVTANGTANAPPQMLQIEYVTTE